MEEDKIIDVPTTSQLEKVIKQKKYKKDYVKIFKSTVSSLLVVAAIAVLIATLILPVLRVTGNSMNPTLTNDELVICKKHGGYKTGDIIAFYYNNKILLKRVIAKEGDVVDIDLSGNVSVNGVVLDEPYIMEKSLGECDITFPYQVPAERVFVLGDNRATSIDSRSNQVGCVAEENVVGKVIVRLWPTNKMGRFK